ncbi:hypothetical protein [Paraburkholderia sp. BL6665CI2N2]|uniref:hypothetical protein n=1 Tax=Paraburkholderia sp. BL6665CI2N2 TaxID=1938806 RepID=UPI001AB0241B|nr:hypothetical protein [Paraburkholderia sp. BL6665CI2N2]
MAHANPHHRLLIIRRSSWPVDRGNRLFHADLRANWSACDYLIDCFVEAVVSASVFQFDTVRADVL